MVIKRALVKGDRVRKVFEDAIGTVRAVIYTSSFGVGHTYVRVRFDDSAVSEVSSMHNWELLEEETR